MLKRCFFISLALASVAAAVREPLVPAGADGEAAAAAILAEYIEIYEPDLRLGDARDLYGWGCGDSPVGFIFIARPGAEEPVTWEDQSRLKHAFMATAPTVGVEPTPEQQAMWVELKTYRQFTVLFTATGPKVAYFGAVYENVFLTEGVVDVGYGPFENQVGFGVTQKETTSKRVGDEWVPILVYNYFPVFSMDGELFFGPFPPEMLEGNTVPYFDNETLNYPEPAAFNARNTGGG
ncbi:MAG: hypothetical protein NTW26_07240 [bacterium]|nr:hypothetical protein [bacterium]